MAALGVIPPDIITRVSEYIPEIIAYIQTLVDKNMAYEANGSVYFSVANYECCGHKYGKLMPEQVYFPSTLSRNLCHIFYPLIELFGYM
jgi:cysteinyl-tRNA synthetase